MGNINYFTGIVKILENPREKFFNNKIPIVRFRAELPQIRKNRTILLIFWGSLGSDIKNYYQVNDYILIEGYLSIRNKNLKDKKSRKVIITVKKVYPFLLKKNRTGQR